MNVIFELRCLRFFDLMIELQDIQIIFITTKNLASPILHKSIFIYLFFYFFAIIGQELFGAKIT